MTSNEPPPPLYGRAAEQEALDRLLLDVRDGRSRALVLSGEPGIGKTALLNHLVSRLADGVSGDQASTDWAAGTRTSADQASVGRASAGRVVRVTGVETGGEIAYSGLQQICAPLLGLVERLPPDQRGALVTALGLGDTESPGQLQIALAVLGLLAEAAADEGLLVCVVDDWQWIDPPSAWVLAFVARRLDAESVALVFAMSPTATTATADATNATLLAGLPELRLEGLRDEDARALLTTTFPPEELDPVLLDWLILKSRGNPLALLELPREHSAPDPSVG